MIGIENVIPYGVAGAGIGYVKSPAPGACRSNHRVVDDNIVLGSIGCVDAIKRNATSLGTIDQVVADGGTLQAIAVDSRTTCSAIVVDHIVFNGGKSDETSVGAARQAGISIEVDAIPVITVDGIAPNRWTITTVTDIYAMLDGGVAGTVAFDEQILAEASQDAPPRVHVAAVVADDDMIVQDRTYSGAG